jgi:uncharacterized Rossmann fold enzyme
LHNIPKRRNPAAAMAQHAMSIKILHAHGKNFALGEGGGR